MDKTSIFRKRSIDRVNSPEQLNDYIRVANVKVWLVLSAVIIFLIGVIIWATFGTIDSKVSAVTIVKDGNALCYIDALEASKVDLDDVLVIEDSEGTITSMIDKPIKMDNVVEDYAMYLGGFTSESFCYVAKAKIDLADGTYKGNIIVESINPISFVIK